jgi:hypothetical protein
VEKFKIKGEINIYKISKTIEKSRKVFKKIETRKEDERQEKELTLLNGKNRIDFKK